MMRRLVLSVTAVLVATSILFAAAISDDFDCANSGTVSCDLTWTEAAGDAEIASNTYRIVTGSFGVVTTIPTTSTGGADQYGMGTLGPNNQYPWIVMRYTNSGSPYYAFQVDGANGTVEWYQFDNAADTSGDKIGLTVDTGGDMTGVAVAITITGTGANTDVRIWRSPGGLPSAADTWNGNSSPAATWLTTDPAGDAVDSGNFVGIGGQASASNSVTWNDFFAGDLGGGSTPATPKRSLLGLIGGND